MSACLMAFLLLFGQFQHMGWAEEKPIAQTVPDPLCASDEEASHRLAETLTASFQQSFEQVLADAQQYLRKHRSRKAAVVLDLDETLLDNRAYFVMHHCYESGLWDAWIARAEASAIAPTRDFVRWLNQQRFNIFFVSGRREFQRSATEENLRKVGITRYEGLYLKPDDYKHLSATDFKRTAQEDIKAKGYRVRAVIGDQTSDLQNALGKGFKLPNPVYHIP